MVGGGEEGGAGWWCYLPIPTGRNKVYLVPIFFSTTPLGLVYAFKLDSLALDKIYALDKRFPKLTGNFSPYIGFTLIHTPT